MLNEAVNVQNKRVILYAEKQKGTKPATRANFIPYKPNAQSSNAFLCAKLVLLTVTIGLAKPFVF
jgi:hypothetical protein